MTTYNKKTTKGGFVSYYANASTPGDYMLYNKDLATASTVAPTVAPTQAPPVYVPPPAGPPPTYPSLDPSSVYVTPNMTGGANKKCNYKDCDAFEFDDEDSFLYSLKGGCACNSSSVLGGNNMNNTSKSRKNNLSGGAFALTPYITAISLLAARLLTDKQVGFFPVKGGTDKQRRGRRN